MQEQEQSQLSTGQYVHSNELRYLNENYAFSLLDRGTKAHGFFSRIKARFFNALKNRLWGDYLANEKEYQANLVRFLNQLSKSLDRKYWQDIKEDNAASYFSLEKKFSQEIGKTAIALQQEISDLKAAQAKTDGQLTTLNSVAMGLEKLLLQITGNRIDAPTGERAPSEAASATVDYSYLLLENRYRGSEEEISKRLAFYPSYFKGASLPILEIGAGRGELQKLLKDEGISGYGVELDPGMYEYSRAQGLDVRLENGIEHLQRLENHSLGGVIAVQVIEHLTYAQLKELLFLVNSKVAVGGKVIFETIDSSSLLALTQNYFRDPTHVFPLHPETLQFIIEACGLKTVEVIKRSPYNEQALFQLVEESSYLPPHWLAAVKKINANFEALNKIFYGHQDYCLIAEVR